MKLRGIEFGNVFCASGARNFFGEGYWFHPLFKLVGMNYLGLTIISCILWLFGRNYLGSTFVAKTTTLPFWPGNMELCGRYGTTPREWIPACIKVNVWKGIALNAVGLSGPGLEALLKKGLWQQFKSPFVISFMSVQQTVQARLMEVTGAVSLLCAYKANFGAPFAIEINFSCPNVNINDRQKKMKEMVEEIRETLQRFNLVGVPLIIKLNVLTPPEVAKEIAEIPECDAITCSNTLPWGQKSDVVDWRKLWGTLISPLVNLIKDKPDPNRGGMSGKPLFPLVLAWLKDVQKIGISKPLIMGGGIMCWKNARQLLESGASAIFLGTIGNTKPWRVPGVIWRTNRWCARKSA